MNKDTITRREIHTGGAQLQVREKREGESGRIIEGYAILFDTPSAPFYSSDTEELREVIDRSAVTQELLDSSDIKFTLFHDRQLLLARSKRGEGSLSYEIDGKGVRFSFEAPRTADGDKAVELVRSGIIDGCSFAFSTCYSDPDHVIREVKREGGRKTVTCRVRKMTGIYDMTLTPDPAYPATGAEIRELAGEILGEDKEHAPDIRSYVRKMRESGRFRK